MTPRKKTSEQNDNRNSAGDDDNEDSGNIYVVHDKNYLMNT